MKRLLLLLFSTALLLACQDDFDEVADTSQRHVTLRMDPTDMFAQVLRPSDGLFVLGADAAPGQNRRLRTAVYCYDTTDSLVATATVTADRPQTLTITLRHLQQGAHYRCICLVDIVHDNPQLDYLETWYQLGTRTLTDHHLLKSGDDEETNTAESARQAADHVLLRGIATVVADNQTVDVPLAPATYNGFIVITDTEDVYRAEVSIESARSFYLWTDTPKTVTTHTYRTTFPNGTDIVVPFFATAADTRLPVSLSITDSQGDRSASYLIENDSLRPCVVTVSAATMQAASPRFY